MNGKQRLSPSPMNGYTVCNKYDGNMTNRPDVGCIVIIPFSKISKFLEKRGPGLHHICFHVRNIKDSIDYLKENNIKLIGNEYSIGAEGYKVIFIHPKSTGGILIELAEK